MQLTGLSIENSVSRVVDPFVHAVHAFLFYAYSRGARLQSLMCQTKTDNRTQLGPGRTFPGFQGVGRRRSCDNSPLTWRSKRTQGRVRPSICLKPDGFGIVCSANQRKGCHCGDVLR